MKSFMQFLVESSEKSFSKTVALIGGSYKPPTKAHWYMVQQYAEKADEVIILISNPKSVKSIRTTCFGTVITPEMSKEIFELYISKYGLSSKVKVEISKEPSPITALFKYTDEELKDVNVIFGVSKKGGDEKRFMSAMKYYADNEHINLLDPLQTAVEPLKTSEGEEISATKIRDNLDKPAIIKSLLPEKLSISDVEKVIEILNSGKKLVEDDSSNNSIDSQNNLDEFEDVNIYLSDSILNTSKIACYGLGQTLQDDNGKDVPVNPKKFPTKAIDIIINQGNLAIELFFNTHTKCWNSKYIYNGVPHVLTPNQYEPFFNSMFYERLIQKLQNKWPLSDQFHKELFDGIAAKQIELGYVPTLSEDSEDSEERKFTASGRKIMNFVDNGVSSSDSKFFCWPNINKIYSWSTWKDWKKIKPLCRMRFKYSNDHEYTITLSVIGEQYKNRGFRGLDVTEQPPVQWLTKQENEDVMKLSLVDKFIRHCVEHISKYIALDPEEIYSKINNPEKITTEEIRATQQKVRATLNEIIKKKQVDSFKWS